MLSLSPPSHFILSLTIPLLTLCLLALLNLQLVSASPFTKYTNVGSLLQFLVFHSLTYEASMTIVRILIGWLRGSNTLALFNCLEKFERQNFT